MARRGLVRSFQVSAVFPHLTVLENVRVALQRTLGTSFHFWKRGSSLSVLDGGPCTCSSGSGWAALPQTCGRTALWPQARARDRDHAGDGAAGDAARRAHPGHGHEDVSQVTALIRQAAANRTVLMVEHNMNVVATSPIPSR